jgi:hypothetical protein
MNVSDRILTLFDVDDRDRRAGKLATFRVLVLLAVALDQIALESWLGAAVLFLCALASMAPRAGRAASAVAFVWVFAYCVSSFPDVANHTYLEIVVLGLACGLNPSSDEERDLLLQSLRWLTVIVFFYAGLQKLWYGHYFDGRVLAMLAGWSANARTAFELLLPSEEMQRLLSYQTADPRGPYLVDSTFFLVLSNLAWMTELLAAALLLVPRTRPVGVLVALSTMVAIEFIARELVFGLLMAALICLFARADLNRRLLPAYLALMAVMLGTRLEWLPAMYWN